MGAVEAEAKTAVGRNGHSRLRQASGIAVGGEINPEIVGHQ